MINSNIKKAYSIALKAHNNQYDKANVSYIFHPLHIAKQLENEDEIITALLHDVIEDSSFTLEDLSNMGFNASIINALNALTRRNKEGYFEYIKRVKENKLARKIKKLDLLHNMDLKRLNNITKKDLDRVEKYKKAYEMLK